MAAYAATVTLDFPHAIRIGNGPLAILTGKVDITNYNSTLAAITGITGQFKSVLGVCLTSLADNGGHWGHWVAASSSIKCYEIDTGAVAQADDDDDVGTFSFVAVGIL